MSVMVAAAVMVAVLLSARPRVVRARPGASLPVAAQWWVRRWSARPFGRRGRVAHQSARVLELCEELHGELAAGTAPGNVLESIAGRWPELERVVGAQRFGESPAAALRVLAATPGAGDLRLLAAAWDLSARQGSGLSGALTVIAGLLGERDRTRRVVRAELASARSTARLLAVLPIVTLLMGAGSGGDPLHFLLFSPPGWICLIVGLALQAAGLAWIEAIANAVERDA